MKRFVLGFVCGALVAATIGAFAARVVGENGRLQGWTITIDGEEVCSDPTARISQRDIECD